MGASLVEKSSDFSWGYVSENASEDVPDSIGLMMYYDRSSGQSKDTIRVADSMVLSAGVSAYNEAIASYNAAVD